ncbi:unnamed protein product [Closterium sp. NIES-54]
MALCPSSVPLRTPLLSPLASSLPDIPDPESDLARAASPTVPRLPATVVTDPSFESIAASALIAELVDFAAACRLDYATILVVESESDCPPSVGGGCALGTDVLEDRQEDFECLAAAVPHLVAMLLALEGDPDALDIPTPRSYAEAITVATGAGDSGGATTQPQPSALRHLLSLPPTATEFPVAGTTPPLLFPPTDQSQPQLLPGSPLPAPAPHTKLTASLTARREPKTRASTRERREPETRASVPALVCRVRRPRAPAVPGTHDMTLRPSYVPQRVVLSSPPASSLPHVSNPESNIVRGASSSVTPLLATVVTEPSFKSAAASALVAKLVYFAALCRLDYAASLVFYSSCPPSVEGELALGCDVLEDRQFELECLADTDTALP